MLSKRTFVCVQSSTINSVPQKQYGSKNEAFWTWRLREWQRCENRWQIVFALHFSVLKRVLNRIWNWYLMQTSFCQNGVWFTTSIVWPVEYNIIKERESKNNLSYFELLRTLELEGNKSQKTIPVMWQYTCLQWVLTV